MSKPKIVCLCGSTRFKKEFQEASSREAKKGHIVLTVSSCSHAEGIRLSSKVKASFDALHLKRIDLADEVIILNVGGYIGVSTKNELAYALSSNKTITFLEPTIKHKLPPNNNNKTSKEASCQMSMW